MALGLALFYWGGTLPFALTGLLIFGVLAPARPDLGLLFVPLTMPLYLIPAAIPGLRADASRPFLLPVHEAALLVVAVATVVGWAWRFVRIKNQEPSIGSSPWHCCASMRRSCYFLRQVLGPLDCDRARASPDRISTPYRRAADVLCAA